MKKCLFMLMASLLFMACGDDENDDGKIVEPSTPPAEEEDTQFKVIATCEVGYEPEGIALYKGHLFVANTGGYAEQEGHEYETTVSIIDAATMRVVKTIDTHVPNLYGEMSQSGRYLCINSPGDYYEVPSCGIVFDCEKALNGDEDCFVVFDYPVTYNTATLDGKFLAVGSAFSYLTGEYEFSQLTITPQTMIETGGERGLEQTLPGSMKAAFMNMSQPYGIYVNPYTGYIYGTDAGSFEGAGYLYQWSPEGAFLGKHKVYINPGHFLALPSDGELSGQEAERLIICNEGMWQADNGRLSYFENGSIVSNQWFRDKNGTKLGDTPNDIIKINDNLIAIAINWSNIVQFIKPDGTAVAATEDIPNNRRLCSDGQYVYVTSYGHECETIKGTKYFDKGFVAKIDIKESH